MLCRVGEVMGSRIIWMHRVCTSFTCIWCVQGWNQRSSKKGRIPGADLEGGVLCSGRDPDPPLLELSNYTYQRTTFQDFRRYQGVTLLKLFSSLRSSVITFSSNESTCTMIRHYRSTILQITLEFSWLCIVHILSTPVQNNYFFL